MGDVMQDAAPYPRELVRTVTLKDGFSTRIRPIRPDDEPRLVDLYGKSSRFPTVSAGREASGARVSSSGDRGGG